MTRRSTRLLAPPGTKWCPRCKEFKIAGEFNGGYCSVCSKSIRKEWYQKSNYYREVLGELLDGAIAAYGACTCGENNPKELQIYPSTGNGLANSLYRVRKLGYPPEFSIRCKKCAKKLRKLDKK